MRPQIRALILNLVRGVVALGTAFVAFYAGATLLFAIGFAREASKWDDVHVYGDRDSDSALVDIYAQPPFGAAEWLGLSALVTVAWAIVIAGVWIVVRLVVAAARPRASRNPYLRPTRLAAPVFLWGVVALSVYALAIYLWNWLEWKHVLEAGLILEGDPKPEPNPAFDPWQIPLGIVAFGVIAAIALVVLWVLARRRRALGTSAPRQP